MEKIRTTVSVAAVILIACCLRAPFTGTGSIVGMIQEELSLSSGSAGLLTSIPLLTFGLLSACMGLIGRKYGAGRVMVTGAGLMIAGILIRSFLGTAGLFAGTVILGGGIVIGNVLVPAVVKDFFPERSGEMTGIYTTVMSVMSGIAGGVSVPLAECAGWRTALAVWAAPAVLAMMSWIPCRRMRLCEGARSSTFSAVLRSPVAWAAGVYMGLQSLIFYSFVAWFATILQSRGYSLDAAGLYNSLYLFTGLLGSFAAPVIAERCANKVRFGGFLGILYGTGMLFLIFGTGAAGVWMVILFCGFCQGACFSYSMLMFVFHTESASAASLMSGFGQSVGYLIACVGPVLFGAVYDAAGRWEPAMWIMLAVCGVLAVLGAYIGQEKYVG